MMLMGAMSGYGTAYATGNPWLGLLAGTLVGGGMAILHAFITVTLRADQVVSGLALTFLGAGMSAVLGSSLTQVKSAPKLPAFDIPGLAQIPVIGPIFFQHNVIVYIGFVLAPLIWFYIYRTRPGWNCGRSANILPRRMCRALTSMRNATFMSLSVACLLEWLVPRSAWQLPHSGWMA
jgi:ABC-type uncharacterized transport system permease subunit